MKNIRNGFPIFKHDKKLVYLDSAATSLKPQCVIDAMNEYYAQYSANVHRGLYKISEVATEKYEGARREVARFINAASEKEIVFTSGATAAINFAARGWAERNIKSGEEIILSIAEHHSNLVPWQMLAKRINCVLKFIDVDDSGMLRMDQFEKLLTRRTKLVAISHISNALGTINPVKQIVQRAHAIGAKVLIDAAQSVPHMPIDVQAIGADFLVFSGHKMFGPTGIGVLYGTSRMLEKMDPVFGGGDMISEVYKTHSKWNQIPYCFEAGTPPIAEAIGLARAIQFMEEIGMKNLQNHEKSLLEAAIATLSKNESLELMGPLDSKLQSGVLSFQVKGVHPHDVAEILNENGIAVRAGHHCCMPLMDRFKVPGTVRASFHIYNSQEDIDRLATALKKVKKVFNV